MKPLEEYMLFTKNSAEKVEVTNSQGVRTAQCSARFDVPPDLQLQNSLFNIHNGSLVNICGIKLSLINLNHKFFLNVF